MKQTHGFSLISFLLYFSTLSLITSLVCYTLSSFIVPSLIAIRSYQTYISLHIATDAFVHDVRLLSHHKLPLKHITSQELIWQGGKITHNKDIGWRFNEHKLERIEGVYINGWKTKKTHCIVNNVTQGFFVVDKGILLTFVPTHDLTYKVESYVALTT